MLSKDEKKIISYGQKKIYLFSNYFCHAIFYITNSIFISTYNILIVVFDLD